MTYFIYIIYSSCIDRYYVGYSSNPWNRLNQHNSNSKDKYTGRTSDILIFFPEIKNGDPINFDQISARVTS